MLVHKVLTLMYNVYNMLHMALDRRKRRIVTNTNNMERKLKHLDRTLTVCKGTAIIVPH